MADDAVKQAQEAAAAAAEAAEALQAQAQEAVRRAEEAAALAQAAFEAQQQAADAAAAGEGRRSRRSPQPRSPRRRERERDPLEPAVRAARPRPTPQPPPPPPPPRRRRPGGLDADQIASIRESYALQGAALEMGDLVDGDPMPDAQVRIPLSMMNRHGLVAGATGTGKTRTLQALAEQLAANGVAVSPPTSRATSRASRARRGEREAADAHRWHRAGVDAASFPVEFFSLGGIGKGVPIRATVAGSARCCRARSSGSTTPRSRASASSSTTPRTPGSRCSTSRTCGPCCSTSRATRARSSSRASAASRRPRSASSCASSSRSPRPGADVFFGEPEIDTAEFLRVASDGRGIVSLLEVPGVADRPALYSTFLMWLLADLFNDLPEVGDPDKPKLVFFFDEAHLLFNDASKDFLQQVVQTVRLIRSKGVGVFFVTQTPKDVPGRRARPARVARAAPAARVHPRRRQGPARHRLDVPEVGLRARGGAHEPRHGRGHRHRHEREGRPEPRRLDPLAGTASARCRRRPRPRSTPPSPPRRCRRSTARPSTAKLRTSFIPRKRQRRRRTAAKASEDAATRAKADAEFGEQQAAIEKQRAKEHKAAQAEDELADEVHVRPPRARPPRRARARRAATSCSSRCSAPRPRATSHEVVEGIFGTRRRKNATSEGMPPAGRGSRARCPVYPRTPRV